MMAEAADAVPGAAGVAADDAAGAFAAVFGPLPGAVAAMQAQQDVMQAQLAALPGVIAAAVQQQAAADLVRRHLAGNRRRPRCQRVGR